MGLLLTGVFGGEVVAQTASSPQSHVVEIRDFAFHPTHIVINPGDTVAWVNKDFVPHFVSIADGKWQSDILEEDQTWEHIADERGSFHYICIFHPEMAGDFMAHSRPSQIMNQP